MFSSQKNKHDYEIVTPPCDLFLDIDLLKAHLRIPFSDATDDLYLNQTVKAVAQFFERKTNTVLLTTTYRLHIDNFCDDVIHVRRKPNVTIIDIQYYKDAVLTTVDPLIYYQSYSTGYAPIQTFDNKDWPNDLDERAKAVQINFTAGYGSNYDALPADLQIALMHHITAIYENRGDCSECESLMPETSQMIYQSYEVNSLNLGA